MFPFDEKSFSSTTNKMCFFRVFLAFFSHIIHFSSFVLLNMADDVYNPFAL